MNLDLQRTLTSETTSTFRPINHFHLWKLLLQSDLSTTITCETTATFRSTNYFHLWNLCCSQIYQPMSPLKPLLQSDLSTTFTSETTAAVRSIKPFHLWNRCCSQITSETTSAIWLKIKLTSNRICSQIYLLIPLSLCTSSGFYWVGRLMRCFYFFIKFISQLQSNS